MSPSKADLVRQPFVLTVSSAPAATGSPLEGLLDQRAACLRGSWTMGSPLEWHLDQRAVRSRGSWTRGQTRFPSFQQRFLLGTTTLEM